MNNKIYKKLFVGFGFVIIVLTLTLFVMSQTYIQNLVYHERLSQMEEVTHQMFHSLEDVIDTHWNDVDVQCNYLAYTPMETTDDLFSYLEKLSELANYKEKQIELIAVDAAGHYYTARGRMGLLREMTYLEDAPERVSYVSNSLTMDDSRMVFLEQLSTPITLQSETGEITLRYFGISQSMTQLNDYFRCDAYENNNSVYVLDNDGFKLFNANDAELLKGHNVYTVLSQMSYLHGSSFAAAKERLARTGSCYSNAVLDGTEYYYALKQMENAQWTLAFLVPAEYVAVNTQKLVNIVMVVIVGFATVFSIMAVIAGWFLLREKQQRELQAEKKTNLRLEQYNIQLTQANDEMRRAQDAICHIDAKATEIIVEHILVKGHGLDKHATGRVRQVDEVEVTLHHTILARLSVYRDISIVEINLLTIFLEREIIFVDVGSLAILEGNMPVSSLHIHNVYVIALFIKERVQALT